jgi:hypothetical protein
MGETSSGQGTGGPHGILGDPRVGREGGREARGRRRKDGEGKRSRLGGGGEGEIRSMKVCPGLTGWLSGWLVGWLIGCLLAWSVGWFSFAQVSSIQPHPSWHDQTKQTTLEPKATNLESFNK